VEVPALLTTLRQWFEISGDIIAGLPQSAAPQVEVSFEGSLNHLEGRMVFVYGKTRRRAGMMEVELLTMENGEGVLVSPDLERMAEDALRQWGFEGPGRQGEFVLREPQAILRFHAHGVGCLDPEWIVIRGERFSEFARDIVPIKPVYRFAGSTEDWLEMELTYQAGDGTPITREEVQRLLDTGRSDHSLGGDRLAVLDAEQADQAMETLADCDPRQGAPGVFRMDARQAAYLRESVIELGLLAGEQQSQAGDGGTALELGPLETVLRPYQREGVAWLGKLSELRMGGILADDMGLGKTLQALAFLAARRGTALVVCPSSLVHNWLAEAGKFVPDLKAVAIEGPKRKEVLAAHPGADLLITSYALLRLDIDLYREREFEVVILDEAQHIKNPESQVSRAAFRLPGTHRFALTGTPIENSVKDLWSIMNFVMPGYLGERSQFGDRFEKPLARGDAPELQRRLARRLKPVILRRLKEEVAKDLPEKIEQVRYCELSDSQRQVYKSILEESRGMIHDAEGGRRRMLALTALLRLRQACCDLRLLNLPGVDEEDGSVKMEELEGLLEEAVAGGHRVLVFSQFVQMLQGIVPVLMEKGFEFCYLDGQTRNRGEVVRRFQESSVPVFLISLKAGGVGLNLTGADTVIHVDPWWNPAVEAQATDRAHRIGQKRVVTSYRLITRNTVEEKILALQERKRKLIASTLDQDVSGSGAGLSENEIFELFG
jgi:superfamily II DNA or RNA helicase